MDKTVAGVLGAVSALATAFSAQAATLPPPIAQTAMQANSYKDLLRPIPNAQALLEASDAAQAEADGARIMTVQYYHHHHHHHHHRHYRRVHHHHHHHHHSAARVINHVLGNIARQ
jgi:hypothetical protein